MGKGCVDMHLHRLLSGQRFIQQRNNTLFNTLLDRNNSLNKIKRDAYIKSDKLSYITNTYSANKQVKKSISKELMDTINNNITSLRRHGSLYEYNGISFTVDQIPEINESLFDQVKAQNNILDFGSKNYFKYISKDGKEHFLHSSDRGVIGSINTEVMRGAPHDVVTQRYSRFWNYLTGDTTFLRLNYSRQEIIEYLDEAGIQPGFFTVKMGDTEAVKFYSTGENGAIVYEKERYDKLFKGLTEDKTFLMDYEPGSIFKVGSKEYILNDDHALNISYGDDIFNIEYPRLYT